jgi:hypothetical protein
MSKINRIPKAITSYGELCTIEAYSDQTYDDYGDLLISTTSDYTDVKAIFNTDIVNERGEIEGKFQEGEGTFYFKGDQDGIENQNIIIRSDGVRYKIKRVDKHFYKGTTVVKEARVGRE